MRDSDVFPEESEDCALLLDELAIGDGNGIYGFGSVLSVLIKEADIDGVRRHLDVAAANGFAASAGHLCLAARLPSEERVRGRGPAAARARRAARRRVFGQRADARPARRLDGALESRARSRRQGSRVAERPRLGLSFR